MDQKILDLKHVRRDLPGGGMVLILNTGAVITPEDEAMLQALHSRSVGGILAHLLKLARKGAQSFMQMFYVGYGHKSIGDCGSITLFIEGVSMLAAKAIQDWLLYCGQEASTRYVDFSVQRFFDAIKHYLSPTIQETWRSFYLEAQEPTRAHLRTLFPIGENEDPKVYEKAINARSFDILRGFLPAGATTNLSWHTNLRQAADHIMYLRHHPLEEVRVVAKAMEDALLEAYPSSFSQKLYEASETYRHGWMTSHYYHRGYFFRQSSEIVADAPTRRVIVENDAIDRGLLEQEYLECFKHRPAYTELPKQMGECGTMRLSFLIDFGSFRDIQRHRAVIQRMPLLSTDFGFHPWYLESLPADLAAEARKLLLCQFASISCMTSDPVLQQYYLPMGLCVPCRLTGDLPALVYLIERRGQTDVHPTLQEVALQMADELLGRFGESGLELHIDRRQGRFDIKRGKQDITERK